MSNVIVALNIFSKVEEREDGTPILDTWRLHIKRGGTRLVLTRSECERLKDYLGVAPIGLLTVELLQSLDPEKRRDGHGHVFAPLRPEEVARIRAIVRADARKQLRP